MKNRKKYYGNYLGIIIQNNDPDRRGRCKVFIPHISANVYNKWYSNDTQGNSPKDKTFKFFGKNIQTSLTEDILAELKDILPWSECAMPLVGTTGAGRYNAHLDVGTISDSSNSNTIEEDLASHSDTNKELELNDQGIGESPGRKYELQKLRLRDAFTDTGSDTLNKSNRVNKYGYHYTPKTYSNKPKGSFTVPNVGAHVWVFFREGNPNNPVYFATSYGQEQWKSIYDINNDKGVDYPESYENKNVNDDPNYDINTDTYRSKYVLNQKAGALEFINTDNREILKMTHYSGSFKEFNNFTNSELAVGNDQKLILKDSFLTTRGFNSSFIGRDDDNIIKGDQFIKVGLLDQELHNEWKALGREIENYKQLFDIKRCVNIHESQDTASDGKPVIFRKTSHLQTQAGTFAPCPVCADNERMDYYWSLNNKFNSVSDLITNSNSNDPSNPSNIKYDTLTDPTYGPIGLTGSIFGEICPVCLGTGESPSSMNGTWDEELKKGKAFFDKKVKKVAEKLIEIERKLGHGGSQIVNVAKHKVETIGLSMNDFSSIRVDEKGKMYRSGVIVHPEGTFNTQEPTPLVEYVHVDDLPGGSYTLNVCNRWNVQVGAGGISMKSYGTTDIGGSIVNVAGEQVNVASQGEVNIDGGRRLTLVGDVVSLRQRKRGQVLVDSNLGVSQNVVIGGGAHVEGELTVNHVTAPVEIQETELTEVFAKLLSGLTFNAKISNTLKGSVFSKDYGKCGTIGGSCKITLTADSNDNKVRCYDHSHNFKNLPLHLMSDNKGVRVKAADNNESDRVQPQSVEKVNASNKVK